MSTIYLITFYRELSSREQMAAHGRLTRQVASCHAAARHASAVYRADQEPLEPLIRLAAA